MTLEKFLERIDEIMCGTSNAERAYLENLYNEVVTPHWIKVEDDLPKINPNGSEWEYSGLSPTGCTRQNHRRKEIEK